MDDRTSFIIGDVNILYSIIFLNKFYLINYKMMIDSIGTSENDESYLSDLY